MKYVGIDPGFQGAVASLEPAQVWDTPTLIVGNGKKQKTEFSVPEMWRTLHRAIENADEVIVIIEEVGPRPMEGVVSVARFAEGYGIWRGLIVALKLRYYRIPPSVWKRDVFKERGMEKDASVAKAEQLWPTIQFRTERGRLLDGRAEALLMADYGKRMHTQGKL